MGTHRPGAFLFAALHTVWNVLTFPLLVALLALLVLEPRSLPFVLVVLGYRLFMLGSVGALWWRFARRRYASLVATMLLPVFDLLLLITFFAVTRVSL